MIYQLWLNLTRTRRKKKYIKSALMKAESKIWENEFLKHQLWEVRGNMREQYDWLRERVDGAIRHLAENKYQVFYSEDGSEVKIKDLPLPPREIDTLPNKPTAPHRYHKIERQWNDKKEAEKSVEMNNQLQRIIDQRNPDLDQQKKQLEGVDRKVAEIDGAIAGLYELKKSLLSMLRKI